jgi:hypothetical protein
MNQGHWTIKFECVKFSEFDLLLLAVITPNAIFVFKYPPHRRPFTATTGKRVTGDNIVVHAPRYEDLETSCRSIVKKLSLCACTLIYEIRW